MLSLDTHNIFISTIYKNSIEFNLIIDLDWIKLRMLEMYVWWVWGGRMDGLIGAKKKQKKAKERNKQYGKANKASHRKAFLY